MNFKCQRCGWCCKNVVINVSYSDIIRWWKEKRYDILKEISYLANYGKMGDGFYIAKTTFAPKQPCPFLRENSCTIHDTRPLSCKDFPKAHAKNEKQKIKCPARKNFELDRENLYLLKKKQVIDFKKAEENKEKLLKILIDSRKILVGEI